MIRVQYWIECDSCHDDSDNGGDTEQEAIDVAVTVHGWKVDDEDLCRSCREARESGEYLAP